jgi:hypothetical protein
LYENDIQQDTGAESETLSYSKATSAGNYSVAFLIDCGSETYWLNDSYSVAYTSIILKHENYEENKDNWFFSATTNVDMSYYVWDNSSLIESGNKTVGFFSISQDFVYSIGKHIVKIKFNTSNDVVWAGGSYDIDTTLVLDDFDPDQDNETVSLSFEIQAIDGTTLSYTVWETTAGGTRVANGSITVTESHSVSILWEKSSANIRANATVIFSDSTSTTNKTVNYIVVQPKTVNDIDSGYYDDRDTYNNETNIYPQEGELELQFVIGVSSVSFLGIFLGGLLMWWKNREDEKKKFFATRASR